MDREGSCWSVRLNDTTPKNSRLERALWTSIQPPQLYLQMVTNFNMEHVLYRSRLSCTDATLCCNLHDGSWKVQAYMEGAAGAYHIAVQLVE